MANQDAWNVAPSDDEFLTRQGANNREVILAAGFADGVPPWRIGEVAGYGAGKSNDPEKQRKNWAASVSRAARRGGRVIPRIQGLIEALRHFRANGEAPSVADEREVLEKLSAVIRGSNDSQIISAGKALLESYRRDQAPKCRPVGEYIRQLVAEVGPERTRRGLEELGHGHLTYKYPDLFEVEDYDVRLLKLEQKTLEEGNEESRPATRRVSDDTRNFKSGGSRRFGDDAARKMDEGSADASGTDAGQRAVGGRDVEARLSELEQRNDGQQKVEAQAATSTSTI